VTAVLVLEADGVLTGGNLTSSVAFGVSLPSTVAGLRRRIVAADSGPVNDNGGADHVEEDQCFFALQVQHAIHHQVGDKL